MFANDTNLFLSNGNTAIFSTINIKLEKISLGFIANRLSLILKNTKQTLFHKNLVKIAFY